MKNYHIAVIIQRPDKNGEIKNYARTIKTNKSYNLCCQLDYNQFKITAANICDSKKEAEATVAAWNEQFRTNGTYMYA